MIHVCSKIFTFWENFKWVWYTWLSGVMEDAANTWVSDLIYMEMFPHKKKLMLNLKYICIIHLQLDYKVMCNSLSDQMILYCDNDWACTVHVHKGMYIVRQCIWFDHFLYVIIRASKCLSTCNVKSLTRLYTHTY